MKNIHFRSYLAPPDLSSVSVPFKDICRQQDHCSLSEHLLLKALSQVSQPSLALVTQIALLPSAERFVQSRRDLTSANDSMSCPCRLLLVFWSSHNVDLMQVHNFIQHNTSSFSNVLAENHT